MGWYHAQLGNHDEADPYCREALALFEKLGNRAGQAHTLDSLGCVHLLRGRHGEAADCFRRALALHEETDARYYQTVALTHLGETHAAAGEPSEARRAWERAVAILDEMDHPEAAQVRARLDGLGPASGRPLPSAPRRRPARHG
jgi:tetratricopeptide (TPR) repeat protein